MKVLVTGGAGFIGSHLVEQLLRDGHVVNVLDDLSTGRRENLPVDDADLNLIVADVTDPDALEAGLKGADAFVHLAAVASVEASVRDPLATHRTNLEGSIRLFDTAARLGVRRAVFASSAAVYGDNPALPLNEEAEKRPLSPYAADKLAGEHYLAFYHRSGRLNATAFRFFNVFGPRQDPTSPYSGVISIFLGRASRGAPITVHGDGMQTRDFIYVSDVVRAITLSLYQGGSLGPEMPTYNVGRGEQVSLIRLLETVEGLPGVNGLRVAHGPAREGDIAHSLADMTRLLATGWRPLTSVESGLRFVLEDMRTRV